MLRVGQLLNGAIFSLLLCVVVATNIPYGTVDAWWEALFECAIFAITALWLLEIILQGAKFRRVAILLPLALIVGFAFLQATSLPASLKVVTQTPQRTLSIDQFQTYLTARKALALLLFTGLLLLHTNSTKRLNWLMRVVVGLGVASAIFGILRQLLQSKGSEEGFVLPFLFYATGYGQYLYHNLFAYLMEMAIALVAGLMLGGGVRRDRILIYLAPALLMWAALVLSLSRGGIIGFSCMTIFLLFVSLRWYSSRRLAVDDGEDHRVLSFIRESMFLRIAFIALIVSALVVGVFWMGGEEFSGRLFEGVASRDSVDKLSRTAAWSSTWKLIKQRPVTGVGFGTYFLAIPQLQEGAGRIRLEEAHNDYLDLAANGGVISVALAVWFVVLLIARVRSIFRSADLRRRSLCLGAVAGILGIAAHSMVDFCLQITGIALVFAALIVLAVAFDDGEAGTSGNRVIGSERFSQTGSG